MRVKTEPQSAIAPPHGAEAYGRIVGLLGSERAAAAIDSFEASLRAAMVEDPENDFSRERLAREAHVLVSTASLFGLTALAERCEELQYACVDKEKASVSYHRMRPELDRALAQVARMRIKAGSVKSEPQSEESNRNFEL
jgi:HPt (histidine-containing phosphotransfer) domain-containing protein